jgi:hypothetical protein
MEFMPLDLRYPASCLGNGIVVLDRFLDQLPLRIQIFYMGQIDLVA